MTDHYGDAIRAGAAALAKPYREPETIRAFTDEYPTLAAARVLDAALPHMRAAILAEGIAPGPCPATNAVPAFLPPGEGEAEKRRLYALCDLRAGHAGQHEAEDEQWGHFRWTEVPALAERCTSLHQTSAEQIIDHNSRIPAMAVQCEREYRHIGYHVAETYVWNNGGTVVAQ